MLVGWLSSQIHSKSAFDQAPFPRINIIDSLNRRKSEVQTPEHKVLPLPELEVAALAAASGALMVITGREIVRLSAMKEL